MAGVLPETSLYTRQRNTPKHSFVRLIPNTKYNKFSGSIGINSSFFYPLRIPNKTELVTMINFFKAVLSILLVNEVTAFVGPSPITSTRLSSSALSMLDVSSLYETSNALSNAVSSSDLVVAETEAWVQPLAFVLGPFLNFLSFAMVSFRRKSRATIVVVHNRCCS